MDEDSTSDTALSSVPASRPGPSTQIASNEGIQMITEPVDDGEVVTVVDFRNQLYGKNLPNGTLGP